MRDEYQKIVDELRSLAQREKAEKDAVEESYKPLAQAVRERCAQLGHIKGKTMSAWMRDSWLDERAIGKRTHHFDCLICSARIEQTVEEGVAP